MNDDEVFIVAQLGVGAVFGLVCALIAPNRGRSGVGWFFIGFFIGCVGLIVLLLIVIMGTPFIQNAPPL